MKTNTAKVTEQQENKGKGYVIGELTKAHIAKFAEGIVAAGVVGINCITEAVEVAASFPKWQVGEEKAIAAFKALSKAVKEELVAAGLKENTAQGNSVNFCNIVKVAQLKVIKVQTGKTKSGKPILSEVKSSKFFSEMQSWADAYHAAQKALRINGLSKRAERPKGVKPLDKAAMVDMIDKIIASVRMSSEIPNAFAAMQQLSDAKNNIRGTKLETLKEANRKEQIHAGLIAHKKGLSRGQKAWATRKANELKNKRAIEQARVMH